MVAELQTEDATAIDWQPVVSAEGPSPTLRLLAKVPYVDERLRLSISESPDEMLLVDRQPADQPLLDADVDLPDLQAERLPQTDSQSFHGLPDCPEKVVERDAERDSQLDLHQVVTPGLPVESGWVSRLCELHETVAPYAGLIVTFALFMSVGLLYWLVFGPFPNANQSQEPMGMDLIGQYSSDPETTITSAPVWSAPGALPVVAKEQSVQAVSGQHDPNPDMTPVDDPRPYPKTRYRPSDYAQSEANGQEPCDRHEIARRPERNHIGANQAPLDKIIQ